METLEKKHRAIAKDYYKSSLGTQVIADKYGVYAGHVNNVAAKFEPEGLRKPTDWHIVRVEREDVEKVRDLFTRLGIKHEIPERFELTEYYESKINQK